ncbi:hypothetical protein MMC18_007412 [Xylographa bjoerkii]|nr:hypothetical protein [Xylographa bjoerkii]MCJ1394533.1 hypothetical protein [Xylographa bjoerkii]
MADDEDETYNNTNRAFLQAFLARSTLTYDEAKPILAAIFTAHEKREILPEDVTEADFHSYISAANNAISLYDFEIRSTYHQTTRARAYALVNSTSDPITQLATAHSADEIGYLKRVLDAMFETYNTPRREVMAITSMDAVRLNRPPAVDGRETQNGSATQGSAGQGITGKEAEKMLSTLVDEGWFERSRKGYYSLSPRALMELRGWLMETYNDLGDDDEEEDRPRVLKIKLCYACKEIITIGQRCPKRSCQCRLHDICTQNFFRVQKSKKCPLCQTDWIGDDFVGERAAEATNNSQRRSGGPSVARTSPSAVTPQGSDDDDGVDEEDGG